MGPELIWTFCSREKFPGPAGNIAGGKHRLSLCRVENKSEMDNEVLINPLAPSGHYTYQYFTTHKTHVLPTQCIFVFCVDLRTNSDYFSIRH